MSADRTIDVFPRRPLARRTGWTARLAMLGGPFALAALLAAIVYIDATEVPAIFGDEQTWREGRPVPSLDSRGICRTNVLLISQCRIYVAYEPEPGTTVRNEVSALIFGGLDSPWPEAEIRVDPADSNRFALNLIVDSARLRWVALAEINLVALVFGAAIGLGVWLGLREAWLWRSLAGHPNPIAVRLVRSRLVQNPNHAREITFAYEFEGRTRQGRQRLPVGPVKRGTPPANWRYEEPIRLDAEGTRLLALAGPKGALLVPTTFRPLVLTQTERDQVLAASARDIEGR